MKEHNIKSIGGILGILLILISIPLLSGCLSSESNTPLLLHDNTLYVTCSNLSMTVSGYAGVNLTMVVSGHHNIITVNRSVYLVSLWFATEGNNNTVLLSHNVAPPIVHNQSGNTLGYYDTFNW